MSSSRSSQKASSFPSDCTQILCERQLTQFLDFLFFTYSDKGTSQEHTSENKTKKSAKLIEIHSFKESRPAFDKDKLSNNKYTDLKTDLSVSSFSLPSLGFDGVLVVPDRD